MNTQIIYNIISIVLRISLVHKNIYVCMGTHIDLSSGIANYLDRFLFFPRERMR